MSRLNDRSFWKRGILLDQVFLSNILRNIQFLSPSSSLSIGTSDPEARENGGFLGYACPPTRHLACAHFGISPSPEGLSFRVKVGAGEIRAPQDINKSGELNQGLIGG